MKYYATNGIVSRILATKLIGGGLLFMLCYALTEKTLTSVFLANTLITLIAIGINKLKPELFNKSEKDVIIGMISPLGLIGFIFGKDA